MLAGCATVPAPQPKARQQFRVIGYVSGRTGIDSIDPGRLTHVNYAFAKVRGDDTVVFENADAPAHLAQLRALKAINPDLKIILSIGGWGAEWFSDAALTEESRCRFATSAVMLMKEHQLEGLDIDWEYPGQPGGGNRYRNEDKQNFTLLLEAVRRELDRSGTGYTLSIASAGGRYFRYTEMDKLHVYLDWINVMAYDLAGGWSRATAHHAALRGAEDSTEAYVRQHLAAGIPPSKIVVGVPFYGRMWKWVVNRKSPTGLSEPFDWFVPDIPWATLHRDYLDDPRFAQKWDEAAKAPFLWDRENGTFISYEDPRSLAEKARFVRENKLGGVMFWEQRHDPSSTLVAAVSDALLRPREAQSRTRDGRGSRDRKASRPGSAGSRDARPGSGNRR